MKLFSKGTKLFSILKFKCPHCHEGDFFKSNNPYNFSSMAVTYDNCPNCKRKLLIEPGFYYGAMYVSYAFGVAHIISFVVAKFVLDFEMEFWNFIILVGSALLMISPVYYALSKIVWANMFINFKNESNERS
tara:strand:- start:942 stop:1337 length:396 start_codon:yes stop_codon:yes gene_type:complete